MQSTPVSALLAGVVSFARGSRVRNKAFQTEVETASMNSLTSHSDLRPGPPRGRRKAAGRGRGLSDPAKSEIASEFRTN